MNISRVAPSSGGTKYRSLWVLVAGEIPTHNLRPTGPSVEGGTQLLTRSSVPWCRGLGREAQPRIAPHTRQTSGRPIAWLPLRDNPRHPAEIPESFSHRDKQHPGRRCCRAFDRRKSAESFALRQRMAGPVVAACKVHICARKSARERGKLNRKTRIYFSRPGRELAESGRALWCRLRAQTAPTAQR